MAQPQRKIVLITGANKGIGFETARQLAAQEWQVVITARRVDAGKAAAAALIQKGGAVSFLEMDVSDTGSIRRAANSFGAQFDHLDALINNAGIYPDEGLDILTITREQLAFTFETNTFGPVIVAQAFLPYLRKTKGARIINVSSGYGQFEGLSPSVPSYCLSKLALNGVTVMLGKALAADGIAVNSMCPGWVRTDMGGANATRSVEQGADTAVWLAAEAPLELTGSFVRDRRNISW